VSIQDNVARLRAEIHRAALQTGRVGADITLVAATKTQDASTVQATLAAGVDAVGENRVQEFTEKAAQGAYEGVPVHFIGHLQKNKVRKVVGRAELIQSVDSRALLADIDRVARELSVVQDVLLQVNIGRDPDKFGFCAEDLEALLEKAEKYAHIRVRGLMAILPLEADAHGSKRLFAQMNQVFVDIRAKTYDNVKMDILSMGMSGDFFDAILEGANMVRIGSTIFGSRDYR